MPFQVRDRAGSIYVEVWPNDDPEELGLGLVAVGYDEAAFRGFPCVQATIRYDGEGLRAWFGWLQVIERCDLDGTVSEEVDAVPVFGAECPLYTFGFLPTFSDFPANPHHRDGDWVAHAWVVTILDVVRSRTLAPVVGFRWGYRLASGRPVDLFAPTPLWLDTWESHRRLLESGYPTWQFCHAAMS